MKKQASRGGITESHRDLSAQVARPLRKYLATETGSAGLLLPAAIIALIWANSPLSGSYDSLWHTDLSISLGSGSISLDLRQWLDEGLMALFFFVIGLEVRREISVGEMSERKRVVLPVVAGIGDMLFSHQGGLDIEDLIGYAGRLELDVDQFVLEIEGSLNTGRIQEDVASADASAAHGTPTFFIGGKRHIGPYDAKSLAAELRASTACTATLPL